MTDVLLGPAVVNLKGVRAGDANPLKLTIASAGAPVNLTGTTLRAQVRAKPTDNTVLLEASITITNAAAGQATLYWPGDAVRTLLGTKSSFSGVWDLEMEPASGDPTTIAAGSFAATMDVTR